MEEVVGLLFPFDLWLYRTGSVKSVTKGNSLGNILPYTGYGVRKWLSTDISSLWVSYNFVWWIGVYLVHVLTPSKQLLVEL